MISQGEGCREDVGGGWKHTRQTLEKSPTSKLSATWAHILSDRNVFAPRGVGKRRGPMPLGLFLFLLFSIFLVVTCPRPPVFARPNILVSSFATQARACILSDHNIFYTPRGGENGGVMPLGLFLLIKNLLAKNVS